MVGAGDGQTARMGGHDGRLFILAHLRDEALSVATAGGVASGAEMMRRLDALFGGVNRWKAAAALGVRQGEAESGTVYVARMLRAGADAGVADISAHLVAGLRDANRTLVSTMSLTGQSPGLPTLIRWVRDMDDHVPPTAPQYVARMLRAGADAGVADISAHLVAGLRDANRTLVSTMSLRGQSPDLPTLIRWVRDMDDHVPPTAPQQQAERAAVAHGKTECRREARDDGAVVCWNCGGRGLLAALARPGKFHFAVRGAIVFFAQRQRRG